MRCVLLLILILSSSCSCNDDKNKQNWSVKKCSFVALNDKNKVIVNYDGRAKIIESEYFGYVCDWSDDYSQENHGTAWFINGKEIVFGGHLNHSRQIYFLYDCQTKQINILSNVVELGIDYDFGWYFLLGPPLYAQDAVGAKYELYSNGDLLISLKIGTTCPNIKIHFNKEGVLNFNIDGIQMSFPCTPSFPLSCFSQTKNIVFHQNDDFQAK